MSEMTRFAARVLRFSGERDAAVYAALACWCGGFPLCPRTLRFNRLESRRVAVDQQRWYLAWSAIVAHESALSIHAQSLLRIRLTRLLFPWLDVPRWGARAEAYRQLSRGAQRELWRGPS